LEQLYIVAAYGLALAGLEARVGLVNDVDAAFAAHDLAAGVAALEGLDGCGDFHSGRSRKYGGKGLIKPMYRPPVK